MERSEGGPNMIQTYGVNGRGYLIDVSRYTPVNGRW